MRLCVYVLVFFAICSLGFSATIHVPGVFGNSIQSAIENASAGDVILVEPGTYNENIDFKGMAITVKSTGGPLSTIIDGGSSLDPDYQSVVLFNKGEGLDSVLDGFTITNGLGSVNPSHFQGHHGGGVFCDLASPLIVNNIICKNQITDGVGSGGGVYCYNHASPQLTNNLIYDNHVSMHVSGAGAGGGIYCSAGSSPIIENCTIFNNSSNAGGGIHCYDTAWPKVKHSILWDNESPVGKEIYINSKFSGSDITISYSTVRGGNNEPYVRKYVNPPHNVHWGDGMIEDNPLFVDTPNEDFHLQQDPCQPGITNPCVNGGDPGAPLIGGSTRTDGIDDIGILDMGFHYSGEPTVVELVWFRAIGYLGRVRLGWKTASEIETAGFHVWRSERRFGQYKKITGSMVPAKGGPTWGAEYYISDNNAILGRSYFYKLEELEYTGKSAFYGPVQISWRSR